MDTKLPPFGLGWIPDVPDQRDFTCESEGILPLLRSLKPARRDLPEEIDLRFGDEGEYFFPNASDQGPLNSCTAFAVLALLEYFERRLNGRALEGSPLFLYQVTRNIRNKHYRVSGDTGADLRTAFKALKSVGTVPEEFFPYDVAGFDNEPSQFLYSIAKPINLRFFRLDKTSSNSAEIWERVRAFLSAGFPVAFGFSVPSSLSKDGIVHDRGEYDSVRGGQAVVATGYRMNHQGLGPHIHFRSSWGRGWGDNGNGWLPISFVQKGLARCFWSSLLLDVDENVDTVNELRCPAFLK